MNAISPNLFNQLAQSIQGEVYHGQLDRYMLATDGSIYKKVPMAVVYPKSLKDVVETIRLARSSNLTIHPRGAGSGLCGSSLGNGVVIDFTRYMNRLFHLDPTGQKFECEPGYRCGELSHTLKGSGLFFPPDPSSGEYASLGGMYATNASGAHSVKYGNVADYIEDAQIVLGTGEVLTLSSIARTPLSQLNEPFASLCNLYQNNADLIETAYPSIRHNVTGYNLRSMIKDGHLHLGKLFSGAEGTLGVVTRLTFRLIPKPVHNSLVVAFFDHIGKAARAVNAILPWKPASIEIMDKSLLEFARASEPLLKEKIPSGIDNVMLIEFDGADKAETRTLGQQAKSFLVNKGLTQKAHLAISAEEKQKFWAIRTAAVPILYRLKGQKKVLAVIEDAVVPTEQLEAYFKGLYDILERRQVRYVLYGHIAKGLIHTRPLLNLKDPTDIALLQVIADDVFELVHSLGGVVSGEHGDGRLRSTYISKQYPKIYPLFKRVKKLLDPKHLFNPDIKIPASSNHIPSNQLSCFLRFGEDYQQVDHFQTHLYFEDGFFSEIEKCHGCSKCTTITTATRMCPIYKFTRKESATPKAKANILRALISGAVVADTLYKKTFQEIVAQCVNCGSCKIECPSNVDIPKLALEARSCFVNTKGAPLSHHLVTRVESIGRMMTKMGRSQILMEKIMATNFIGRVNEKLAGISRNRPFLSFAKKNLWDGELGDNKLKNKLGQLQVLYFTGCYAGYLHPEIGQALVSVLQKLNIAVFMLDQHCCGLPLMINGMIKQAKQKINTNLSKWYHLLDKVDHIVVTCSSCGLALMKEWGVLLRDARIKKIERKIIHVSHLISRYLDENHFKGRSAALTYLYPEVARFGSGQDRKVSTSSLRKQKLEPCPGIKDIIRKRTLAYHMPCHLKIQPNATSSIDLLLSLPDLDLKVLDSHCCGMAGTWGLAASNYPLSHKIGSHLISLCNSENVDGIVTDCPTCMIQLKHLGSHPVYHPMEVVNQYLT